MGNIGLPEIILIVLVLIIIFGSKRITDLAREAGETGKQLKKAKDEFYEAKNEVTKGGAD